jgi:hypothetical protein
VEISRHLSRLRPAGGQLESGVGGECEGNLRMGDLSGQLGKRL